MAISGSTVCANCGGTDTMERHLFITLGGTAHKLVYVSATQNWHYTRGTFDISAKFNKWAKPPSGLWQVHVRDTKYRHSGTGATVAKAVQDLQDGMMLNFTQLAGPLGYTVEK